MTRVEVLAPLRLETRFLPDGAGDWVLRLRVYPDDVTSARPASAPTKDELDILEAALDAIPPDAPDPAAAELAAFRSAAAALGAPRAWLLWRTATAVEIGADGSARRTVDRRDESPPARTPVTPTGLPDALDVWLEIAGGHRLAATLHPNHDAIRADLAADALAPAGRTLPRLWWLDFDRAAEVGLAAEFAVTAADAEGIAALYVTGAGQTPAVDLFDAHARSGRLGALAQGTPTNTVDGEPTTPLGDDPATWEPLLATTAESQHTTRGILTAFGAPAARHAEHLPVPGGAGVHAALSGIVVGGLWPVLWGRTIRDIVGTVSGGPAEHDVARWARSDLAVQGPWSAIRVGDQPYGLLPVSDFGASGSVPAAGPDLRWVDDPADTPDDARIERTILSWAVPWRDGAADAAARSAAVFGASPALGASTEQLLALFGRHAPSIHWRLRPVADLPTLQAQQFAANLPLSRATAYDAVAAVAFHGNRFPFAPIAASGARLHLPSPPFDLDEDFDQLDAMLGAPPETLYYGRWENLGLFGHLLRESIILARATIGIAREDVATGREVDLWRRIPLDDDFPTAVMRSEQHDVEVVESAGDAGRRVATRFRLVMRDLSTLIEVCRVDNVGLLREVKAALDAASFRVDPWLTGIAARRAANLAQDGVPFLLGAYGWVDMPRPWRPGVPGVLPPGPTEAGLLHAPSHAQAQVAAVLRDAAVHDSADGRWSVTLTSDRVRRAVALGERVRLGLHPFEALGLEVEAIAGDPDVVRILRVAFPTAPDDAAAPGGAAPNDPRRRVCDGLAVLEAARAGALPPGVPPELAARLGPLDDVLDTYADLLLVDGVHGLVTRSPEAAGAAMEAASGLGSPAGLWGIRTPRAATTVPVECWLVLPAGGVGEAGPAARADPAFAALVGTDRIDDPADPEVVRAARIVGGADAGDADAGSHPEVVSAMVADLADRWQRLVAAATAALDEARGPATPADIDRLSLRWRLALTPPRDGWTAEDRRGEAVAALAARTAAASEADPTDLLGHQRAIRDLVGRPDLPVLAVVPRATLPDWRTQATGALDRSWLEIVAAVRPRLAPIEARQLTDPAPWPSALQAPADDPWAASGRVIVAYGSGLTDGESDVAVALLDGWVDSIPSRRHVTEAAFGFNAPKTRAPQAVLIAVPPDPQQPLDGEGLLRVVVQTRALALARAARPTHREGLPWATPSPVVQLQDPVDFRAGWRS